MSEIKITRILINLIDESPFNPRKFYDEKELKDLAEGIKKDDIIQPLKLRPVAKGRFQVVFGHRRLRAAKIAELKNVPAMVQEMTDDEAEKEQFIENMDRADVHYMDEAIKYNEMLLRPKSTWDVASLAAMVHKSESYIVQRLELAKLIEPFRKIAWKNEMSVSCAIQIARINAISQKEILSSYLFKDPGSFLNIKKVTDWINNNVTRDLAKARFDKTDATLYPQAGPCTLCPKRSGSGLFADIKQKDICMDGVCFGIKLTRAMLTRLEETVEKYPDMVYVHSGYGGAAKAFEAILKKNKIESVSSYDFSSHKTSGGTPTKVMYTDEQDMGRIDTLYKTKQETSKKADLKKLQESGAKPEAIAENIDVQIISINERQKRALELDAEKIWLRVHDEIVWTKEKEGNGLETEDALTAIDNAALIYAMYLKGDSMDIENVFGKSKKYGREATMELYEKFLKATPQQTRKISRIFIRSVLDRSTSSHVASADLFAFKEFIEQYKGKEVKAIEADQKAETDKRLGRAKERVDSLNKQKKTITDSIDKKETNKAVAKKIAIKKSIKKK